MEIFPGLTDLYISPFTSVDSVGSVAEQPEAGGTA